MQIVRFASRARREQFRELLDVEVDVFEEQSDEYELPSRVPTSVAEPTSWLSMSHEEKAEIRPRLFPAFDQADVVPFPSPTKQSSDFDEEAA
ncbi:hypothetical protein AB0A74_02825 [Saccharothrix sp. NPDC042600]|uniref:hypothetical protein n=1 Tax=Saccharothrix TaxID=2071 RepID=UPI003410F767|nr:hypothetical protein GCM10017745_67120 [Saccharothrix mutabilis subsp. capreolus]